MKIFFRCSIFISLLLITLPALAQEDDFSDFDLVRVGSYSYETFLIGENWYQNPKERYVTSFRINKYETTYNLWYSVIS